MTLTFDVLNSNLVHITVSGVGNLPTNVGVSATFCSRHMGQQLTVGPRGLEGHGASWPYGSSYSICIPILKFVGLPVQKILRIYCVSSILPGDLDI